MWRAVRHGLDGELLDLERGEPYPAAAAVEHLLAWTEPARAELAIDVALAPRNGAQRQRDMYAQSSRLDEVYRAMVAETRDTYAGGARNAALK